MNAVPMVMRCGVRQHEAWLHLAPPHVEPAFHEPVPASANAEGFVALEVMRLADLEAIWADLASLGRT